MSTYLYEGYTQDGTTVSGEYDGVSRDAVVHYLLQRNITPLSVQSLVETPRSRKRFSLSFSFLDRISLTDVVFLARNLSATLRAGMGIVEALDIVAADTEKYAMKTTLEKVLAQVKNGKPLSGGFEGNQAFPGIFLGMVKAGEQSGQLDNTLDQAGKYLAKEYNLRHKVRSALIYPIILLIVSALVVTLLLVFVLPRLAKSFETSHLALPLITRVFIWLSNALSWSITLDLIIVACIVFFFTAFQRYQIGKRMLLAIMDKTPVVRELVQKVALVRFSRMFGNLIGSGIPVLDALNLTAGSINNLHYEDAIRSAAQNVRDGIALSESLRRFPRLFPKILTSLMLVGERTGTLSKVLITFSDFYEEDVDTKLKDLTAVLEPILLLVMGGVVAAIALSILLPIYQLVGKFI